jgi:cell division protein ZipA
MELNIRDWMMVIGVLLLIAVSLDGYRRVQRERRNQVRLSKNAKRSSNTAEEDWPTLSELPNGGARVVGKREAVAFDPLNPPEIASELKPLQSQSDAEDLDAIEPQSIYVDDRDEDDVNDGSMHAFGTHAEYDEVALAASQAVNQPQAVSQPQASASPQQQSEKEDYHVDPLFSNPFDSQDDLVEAVEVENKPIEFDKIIVLNVIAVDEGGFAGEDLLHILLACDCRFGEMNMFHRYESENAQGPVQFSIVNLVQPGVFDLNDIKEFSTPGISFFIRLPGPRDPIDAFNCMIETAQCLVRNLNGSLRDEQHSTVTEQTLEHMREDLRTYQTKKNLAL